MILFVACYQLRKKYKRDHHEAGIEGMTFILIAALILIIFYGILDRLAIL